MKKCPTQAIVFVTKTQYMIRESLCFDCGVCGDLCPKSAVLDAQGRPVPKRKLSQRPKPFVDVESSPTAGHKLPPTMCPTTHTASTVHMEPYH